MSNYKTCDSCKYFDDNNLISYEGKCTFHEKDTRTFYEACNKFKRRDDVYPDYYKIVVKVSDYYDAKRIRDRIKLLIHDTEEDFVDRIDIVEGFDDDEEYDY